jgi:hypothetical protein
MDHCHSPLRQVLIVPRAYRGLALEDPACHFSVVTKHLYRR